MDSVGLCSHDDANTNLSLCSAGRKALPLHYEMLSKTRQHANAARGMRCTLYVPCSLINSLVETSHDTTEKAVVG